jgi:hypothetical protein
MRRLLTYIVIVPALVLFAPSTISIRANTATTIEANYTLHFGSELGGGQEIPPVVTPVVGTADLYVLPGEQAIQYVLRLDKNTTERVTAAHLHCAPIGKNGPIAVPLFEFATGTLVQGPIASGQITQDNLTVAARNCSPNIFTLQHLIQATREGGIYANVHSVEHSSGFVRGQLAISTSPASIGGVEVASHSVIPGKPAPYILLSQYYRFPNETFQVHGFGFAGSEQVEIGFAETTDRVTANSRGEFVSSHITVPFSVIDSTQALSARGLTSGIVRTANLAVGSYYPVVTPSSYYVSPGALVSFSGLGFAPGEPVRVIHGDGLLAAVSANGAGAFTTSVLIVSTARGSQTYTFTGQWSGKLASVTIEVSK